METNIRRIVTGHSSNGKSIILSNGEPPRVVTFNNLPGAALIEVWATDNIPNISVIPDIDPTIAMTSFVPEPLGSRFRVVRFPPNSELSTGPQKPSDAEVFRKEFLEKAPGLAEAHEQDGSGMHKTNSVDYDIVISGEIWLELDDCSEVLLKPGDCVIQNGTRHAWRNRGNEACIMACVLMGATR
jgi:mannose-6-phosphate isomerase-like protein (cupin superfamily)